LDLLAYRNEVTDDIPCIENLDALGKGGVGLILLIEGKEDTIEAPLVESDDKVVGTP